jgi:parallel beta-helix repeat protein
MRRFLSMLLALGLVLSLSLAIAVPVQGATYNVPGDYATIQAAITAASSGDTIYVAAGTYNEDITLKDGVDVLGAGADVTTIHGSHTGPVVTATAITSTTTLDGFKIENGAAGYGGGMYNSGASPVVSNCVFDGNTTSGNGGGMYCYSYSSPTITSCTFTNNTATAWGGGIDCEVYSSPTITNCVIAGNTAGRGGGIFSYITPSPVITNNTIVGNTASDRGGGIYVNGSTAMPTITNNIIASNTAPNGSAIYCATATLVIDYNNVYSNTLVNCTSTHGLTTDPNFDDAQYHIIYPDSPCIDAGDNSAPDLPGTDFEGQPRVRDGDGDSIAVVDIGADEYFTNNPPDDPINLGPAEYTDGSTVSDDTPTLTFDQNDPDDDDIQFTIQIDDDSGFSSPAVDYTSTLQTNPGAASFTSSSLPDGDYYWRVMSTDEYGATSGWAVANGGAVAFHLDTSIPPPPSGGAVGGTVYPVDKAALLLPWFALSAAILLALAAGCLIFIRRADRPRKP